MNILYCDDNLQMRSAVPMVLDTVGHIVETVRDGQEALEKIQANPNAFNVLITDNKMPRLTGVKLVEKIRSLNIPIKVIMASAFATPLDAETKARLRLDGVLQKPFSAGALVNCVEALRR